MRAVIYRRCLPLVAASALGLRCFVVAACPPGMEPESHEASAGEARVHQHAAGPSHHDEHSAVPGSGSHDHPVPVQCCESRGGCVFTVAPQTEWNQVAIHVAVIRPVRLEPPSFETRRVTLHAFAHGPPVYLRFSSLLI